MATLKLEIVTPEAKIFEGDVDFVQLPGAEGDMGVYPQHETLVTELKAGRGAHHAEGPRAVAGHRRGLRGDHRRPALASSRTAR